MVTTRKIIHIDMDAFYASVEQRDNPEYLGKPLVVGGSRERGVVAAASYEARKYGIHSAMPSVIAKRKCPHLIFVRPRFDIYSKISKQIHHIFHQYTDLVEPLSLDEAFLDVTENKHSNPSATIIARELKTKIQSDTGLTASAGISINKFLAKIASDYQKPDGLFVIPPEKAEKFVEDLPVEKFFGVGKVTTKKMHNLGIFYGKDLKQWKIEDLIRMFGKTGVFYFHIARAVDNRAVIPDRLRKSIGAENTFNTDISDFNQLRNNLEPISKRVFDRMVSNSLFGRTVTLKIKYANFEIHTRSKTLSLPVNSIDKFNKIVFQLLKNTEIPKIGVRLLGVSVSNLDYGRLSNQPVQLRLNF